MTRFTQISTLAMLAMVASSGFVATAEAKTHKQDCEQTSSFLFRTACETPVHKEYYRPPTSAYPGTPVVNFRGRSDQELGLRSPSNEGGNGGNGGNGGKR